MIQIAHEFEGLSHNFVASTGPTPCRVLFIGESPGQQEDEVGECFVGKTGQELDRFYLPQIGLRRREVRVSNLIPVHPYANRNPTKEEIKFFEPYLLKELAITKPEILVPLGAFATEYFLPGRDLHTTFGLLHRSSRWPDYAIIPSYHPAAGLHQVDSQPLIVYSFQQVALALAGNLPERPKDPFENPAYIELATAADVRGIMPQTSALMGMDTEGYRGCPWGLSFSFEIGVAYVIRAAALDALRELAAWIAAHPECCIILHNALHDLPILREMGVHVVNFEDTMVYSYDLALEPQGLKDLAYRLCGMKMKSYDDVVGPAVRSLTNEYLLKVAATDWGLDPPVAENLAAETVTYRQPQALHKRALKAVNDIYGMYTGTVIGPRNGGSARLDEIGVRVGKVDHESVARLGLRKETLIKGVTKTLKNGKERTTQDKIVVEQTMNAWFAEVPLPIMPELEKLYGEFIWELAAPRPPEEPADSVKRWKAMSTELEESVLRAEAQIGSLPEVGLEALEDQQVAINYSARDAHATIGVRHELYKKIEANGLVKLAELDMSVLPYIDRMRTTGIRVNPTHMYEYGDQLKLEMRALQEKLQRDLGIWMNPSSSKQVAELIYEKLGFPIEVRTKEGMPSTNDKVLEALSTQHENIHDITEYRELHKLRNTYAISLPKWMDERERIHCNWKYTRVASGRLCIAKGTPIEIVRNVGEYPKGIPIEEVRAGDLAYTYGPAGELAIRRVLWAGNTGCKQVIRIHWRGQGRTMSGHLDLTPNHEVMLSDGSYKRACDLKPKDSIRSLSRGLTNWGYERLWATGDVEVKREHRFVWEQLYGPIPDGYHIHHLNENKRDNRPENLEAIDGREHSRRHGLARPIEEMHRRAAFMHTPEALENRRKADAARTGRFELDLQPEWMYAVLHENGGRPTAFRDKYGIDYTTALRYLKRFGIDWRAIKALYTTHNGAGGKKWSKKNNHNVVFIEIIEDPVDVYDLEIEDTHNFIAGGLAVHNSTSEPNLLAIPARSERGKMIRAGFIPEPGHVFVGVDLSQIEMRVLAHYSEDPNLLAIFADPKADFHTRTAAFMWRLTEDAVNADNEKNGSSSMRASGKNVSFGIVYGIGAQGLQAQMKSKTKLDWTVEKCEEMIDLWLNTAYPGVKFYMEKQKHLGRRNGFVASMHGRRRYLPGLNSSIPRIRSEAERMAINHPIQASAREIVKLAAANIWNNALPLFWEAGYYVEPVLDIHDELIFECDAEIAEEWMYVVKTEMENAVQLICPVRADGHISDKSWRGLK